MKKISMLTSIIWNYFYYTWSINNDGIYRTIKIFRLVWNMIWLSCIVPYFIRKKAYIYIPSQLDINMKHPNQS